MSSPAVKMPQIIYAKQHEVSTWNVWIKHKISCHPCLQGRVDECLIGANAFEEWEIAIKRLRDLLP